MSTRESKDGNRITVTEYEVRTLDQYGDVINVDPYDWDDNRAARRVAIEDAKKIMQAAPVSRYDIRAVVVEKHVYSRPALGVADVYTTVATFGDHDAIAAGGWTPMHE